MVGDRVGPATPLGTRTVPSRGFLCLGVMRRDRGTSDTTVDTRGSAKYLKIVNTSGLLEYLVTLQDVNAHQTNTCGIKSDSRLVRLIGTVYLPFPHPIRSSSQVMKAGGSLPSFA